MIPDLAWRKKITVALQRLKLTFDGALLGLFVGEMLGREDGEMLGPCVGEVEGNCSAIKCRND